MSSLVLVLNKVLNQMVLFHCTAQVFSVLFVRNRARVPSPHDQRHLYTQNRSSIPRVFRQNFPSQLSLKLELKHNLDSYQACVDDYSFQKMWSIFNNKSLTSHRVLKQKVLFYTRQGIFCSLCPKQGQVFKPFFFFAPLYPKIDQVLPE